MGRALCQASPGAKAAFEMAEEVTGMPLKSLCFEGPLDELTRTANLQPALTAVSLAALAALEEAGVEPSGAAGHSVGEYPALACAGVLDKARAVALTAMRGDYMERDAHKNPGAMAAIIGLSLAEVSAGVEAVAGVCRVGNHNAETQVVITGEKEAVAEAGRVFKDRGARVVPLKVSGAWHSPLMSEAGNDFAVRLAQTSWRQARLPIYLNLTAQTETDGSKIAEIMAGQLTSPVRWYDIMVNLVADGFDTFIEVGPRRVLTGLMKKHALGQDSLRVFEADGPEKIEALKKALDSGGVDQ